MYRSPFKRNLSSLSCKCRESDSMKPLAVSQSADTPVRLSIANDRSEPFPLNQNDEEKINSAVRTRCPNDSGPKNMPQYKLVLVNQSRDRASFVVRYTSGKQIGEDRVILNPGQYSQGCYVRGTIQRVFVEQLQTYRTRDNEPAGGQGIPVPNNLSMTFQKSDQNGIGSLIKLKTSSFKPFFASTFTTVLSLERDSIA